MRQLMMATLAIGLGAAGAAAQGVVIRSSSKDLPSGNEDKAEVIYVQGGLVRQEDLDGKGRVTDFSIIRDGALWDVDPQDRTYKKLDKAAFQQLAAQMNGMMAAMKGRMAAMPPEQQAMVKKMLAGLQSPDAAAALPKRTWTDAGKTEQVGGYTCHLWESRDGIEIDEQYCVTPWNSVKGGDAMLAAFKNADALIQDLESTSPFPALTKALASHDMAFAESHGFPVVVRHFSGGKPFSEDVVESVDQASIPADKFEIPKGFKEVPAMNLKNMNGGD